MYVEGSLGIHCDTRYFGGHMDVNSVGLMPIYFFLTNTKNNNSASYKHAMHTTHLIANLLIYYNLPHRDLSIDTALTFISSFSGCCGQVSQNVLLFLQHKTDDFWQFNLQQNFLINNVE